MYSSASIEQGTFSVSTTSKAKHKLFKMSVSQSFPNSKIRMKGFSELLNDLNALIPNIKK